MATDSAPKQTDTKPAESPKAVTPVSTTPAKSSASTQTKATAKPKPKSKSRAKTAAKSRTRSTAASSRSRTASKSGARRPAAARTTRTETTATATPRPEAKALNGGQQFVAGVIDAQENTLTAIADYQTRTAELSQIPGASAVAEAQAKVLRSVTDTYVSAARAFLN
jgi:hypothetical protein